MKQFNELDIVARTLYGEARGEVQQFGIAALEGVASVIFNRFRKHPNLFGSTPKEVCLKPYQFSCWLQTDPNYEVLTQNALQDATYSLCHMVASAFLNGDGVDITNGADHYHNKWIQPPFWAKHQPPLMDIGNHRFYKLN